MKIIGMDVGGANLKASDGEGRSLSLAFPMWERVQELRSVLSELLATFAPFDGVALTMTGELADCFSTKAEGVTRIVAAVVEASDRPVLVWQTSGEFVSPEIACEFSMLTAAANWHALATWAGRMSPQGTALLVDVGSTTSDIIPIEDGMPLPMGRTDLERLRSGELLYTGIRRTPVCAVTDAVLIGDGQCPLAAELFATMDDVAILLEEIPENEQRCDTADGRPATRRAAAARLARMLCCDVEELSASQILEIARSVRERQLQQLTAAVSRVAATLPSLPVAVLLSGEGEFLARTAVQRWQESVSSNALLNSVISLSETLGAVHSYAACAFALARLSREGML